MANQNANVYQVIIIDGNNKVQGQNPNGVFENLSEPGFAMDIGISTNGVLWAVSLVPNENSGGNVVYWSLGDGKWNMIQNGAPAIAITGIDNSSCYFLGDDGYVYMMGTDGPYTCITASNEVQEIDFGGDTAWAVFPATPGGIPLLQYSTSMQQIPIPFAVFQGPVSPSAITVSYTGDCNGIIDGNPWFFGKDGSTGSAGAGANGISIDISFKNNFYLLTNDRENSENEVMIWVDEAGGTFQDAGFSAIKVLSTYYLAS